MDPLSFRMSENFQYMVEFNAIWLVHVFYFASSHGVSPSRICGWEFVIVKSTINLSSIQSDCMKGPSTITYNRGYGTYLQGNMNYHGTNYIFKLIKFNCHILNHHTTNFRKIFYMKCIWYSNVVRIFY